VQNSFDSEALYDLIENEIAPLFYTRDSDGIPRGWLRMMKASIAAYAPRFNTDRMVTEYAEEVYRPAAAAWKRLTSNSLQPSRDLVAWQDRVAAAWPRVAVVSVSEAELRAGGEGSAVEVAAAVDLGGLSPEDVSVEVVYGRAQPSGEMSIEASAPLRPNGSGPGTTQVFRGLAVDPPSGRVGYAVRVLPAHPDLYDPYSLGLIRWS